MSQEIVAEVYEKEYRRELNKTYLAQVKGGHRKPWAKYMQRKSEKPMSYQEMVDMIESITKFNLRAAAFMSILYITGSRINELAPYKYDGKFKDEIKITKPPILYGNIWSESDDTLPDGCGWVVIKTRVEKINNIKDTKATIEERTKELSKTTWKEQHFLYHPNSLDYPFLKIIGSYLEQNFVDAPKDTRIFTFGYEVAKRMCNRHMKMNLHAIREIRADHLMRYYGFSTADLQAFIGWKSADMALRYAASNTYAIKQRMKDLI